MTTWKDIIKAVANNEMTAKEAAARYNENVKDILDGVADYRLVKAAHKHTPAPWFNSSCAWR